VCGRWADWKEGYYFGAELGPTHPDVQAKVPMHGANQWPDTKTFPGFGQMIVDYMSACTELGHTILSGLAPTLGLQPVCGCLRFEWSVCFSVDVSAFGAF
jgi:isopenicillin N synthase-like dioxygenase